MGIYSGSDTNRTRAKSLSFYYPRLLYCLDQMLAVVVLSQHWIWSFKTFRPRASVPSKTTILCEKKFVVSINNLKLHQQSTKLMVPILHKFLTHQNVKHTKHTKSCFVIKNKFFCPGSWKKLCYFSR